MTAADTHRDDMAFWMYSSGSTGRPKGVVHLHHDMAYIHACYGSRVLHIRPTLFFALPTLYNGLMNAPSQSGAELSSVRLCLSAAEILAEDLFNAWQARFGLEIVEGLGSTEILHIYLSNTIDAKRPGSAGLRVPGFELKLLDAGDQPVAGGEDGVLWARWSSSAPCYWNKPEKTAETMRGGWIYTADRRMTLKAFVALADGFVPCEELSRELQDYVKSHLVKFKYPRIIEYLPDLPKTGTGKIDRQRLLHNGTDGGKGDK